MIKSMTAYGRAFSSTPQGSWTLEIHAVNRKGLDFQIFMPKDFLCFDLEIRKWLSAAIFRGQVTVKVSFEAQDALKSVSRLCSLKESMEKTALALGFPIEQISFPLVYQEVKNLSVDALENEQALQEELKFAVHEALHQFLLRREIEGQALAAAFSQNLQLMRSLLLEIEAKSLGIQEKYQKKILEKLQEFKEVFAEDRERVLREVFFYAEKVDVSEEITRLHSHFQQFETLLSSQEKSVGRTMDFFIQEMGRELNTLSAKAEGLEILGCALKMRSELEKIREQAQNVE
jgi:uncharacterized protein (TIGR00255 family)